MKVESFLTHEFNIRFMDARLIVSEAKLSLGIHGPPSREQERRLQEQAIAIFRLRPEEAQSKMKRNIAYSAMANAMKLDHIREQSPERCLDDTAIESFLTREFNIRFIAARLVVAEAKLSLGIHGFPTKNQETELREEAIRIFRMRSKKSQVSMRRTNVADSGPSATATDRRYAEFLEAFQSPVGVIVKGKEDWDDFSSCSFSIEETSPSIRYLMGRMWPRSRTRK